MSPLDYITIRGFKSIASIEKLKLEPINVIIGPNGSGKSNFIGAFAFLHAIRNGELVSFVQRSGGAENILHFGSRTTTQIELEIKFGSNKYEISLAPTVEDELVPTSEIAWYYADRYERWTSRHLTNIGKESGISSATQTEIIAEHVRTKLARWRVYHFHDTSSNSPMKKTIDLGDNRFLRADGSNLAAFLYLLRVNHHNEYQLIRRTVQLIAPFFDDFVLEPLAFNSDSIRLEWRHTTSDDYFNADSLSDGTLRFIAIATLLLQPKELRPSVILIDEPELGLHPYAITLLSSLIRQSVGDFSQVIVSTQSPFLLDHFHPEEILVAERVENGTVMNRLDPSSLSQWLEEYSLGQLWEKNQLGGRPLAE